MRANGIVNNVQVVNIPRAGGTIGLSQVSRMKSDGATIMVTGIVMLGGITTSSSDLSLAEMIPVARRRGL